jgi:hypothetical protein
MNHKQFWMTVLAVIVAQVLAGAVSYLVMHKARGLAAGRAA